MLQNYKALVFDLFGVIVEFGPQNTVIAIPEGVQFFHACKAFINQHAPEMQLYVLSNARNETIKLLKTTYPEVFDHFVGITTSEHAGVKKPAIEIFDHFMQQHSLQAHECIFIDDTAANIAAAQTLGFETIHHTSPARSLAQLQKLLKLV